MLKLIVLSFAITLIGCEPKPAPPSEQSTTTTLQSPTTTLQSPTTTLQVVEPGQQPVRLTEIGLKVGKCYRDGSLLLWKRDNWHGEAPACQGAVSENQTCSQEHAKCSSGGQKYSCTQTAKMKCYGWVYEKDVATNKHTPLKDANVDLWNMVFCMAGGCAPLAGPVKTNEFGYYEIEGGNIPDSTNVRAYKDGMYGVCGNDGKPACPGGLCSTGDTIRFPVAEIRPIPLMPITANSCK